MILNLTDKEIEDMLTHEMEENGEYIEFVGSWALSTLESYYSGTCQYDEIVNDNYDRFYEIAKRMW